MNLYNKEHIWHVARGLLNYISDVLGCVFLEINFLISTLSTYFEIQPLDIFCLPTVAQLSLFISRSLQLLCVLCSKAVSATERCTWNFSEGIFIEE